MFLLSLFVFQLNSEIENLGKTNIVLSNIITGTLGTNSTSVNVDYPEGFGDESFVAGFMKYSSGRWETVQSQGSNLVNIMLYPDRITVYNTGYASQPFKLILGHQVES